jgi:predicted esterase
MRCVGLLLCAVALLLAGCDDGSDSAVRTGRLVSAAHLGDISPQILPALLDAAGVPALLELRYRIGIYRIRYTTVDPDDNVVEVSGAIFIPLNAPPAPLASTQHGTQSLRDNVASMAPLIYGADALLLAAEGFVACSPDYLGLGSSTAAHPYLHADTSAATVLDGIRATIQFCRERDIALDGDLFLAGYSQGGYVTLAAQRAIEAGAPLELTLSAVASLSGAYDLVGIVDALLSNPADEDVVLAAYFVTSYNRLYGWDRLDEMFNPLYAGHVESLFDGSRSFDAIEAALAPTVGDLLDPAFVARYLRGEEPEVLAAIADNALLDWTPQTPLRLYHGSADTTVPYANAVTALQTYRQRGAPDVALVTLEGVDHVGGISAAIGPTLEWFRSLRR